MTENKMNSMKTVFITLVSATMIASSGCTSVTKDTLEVEIDAISDEIAYNENGEAVDPLTLVSITRKGTDAEDKAYIEEDLEVTKVSPEVIDTSKIGEVTVYYTVKDTEDNSEAELSHTFEVVDKTAPAFKLKDSKATVKANADFKPESYIKDDAGLTKVDSEPEEGTEFDKGWYTITSNVDTKKAGSYTVKYHAVGNNGVATDAELKVTVEENKEADTKKADSKQSTAKADTSGTKSSKTSTPKASTANTTTPATQPAQDNSAANVTGNDTYNGVLQTPGCKKTTVHHDAITKETSYQEWVEDKPAWTEKYLFCNACGQEFGLDEKAAADHAAEMQLQGDNSHSWSGGDRYHAAEGHYETRTKTEVIVPAYDEQVCQ